MLRLVILMSDFAIIVIIIIINHPDCSIHDIEDRLDRVDVDLDLDRVTPASLQLQLLPRSLDIDV